MLVKETIFASSIKKTYRLHVTEMEMVEMECIENESTVIKR